MGGVLMVGGAKRLQRVQQREGGREGGEEPATFGVGRWEASEGSANGHQPIISI